MQYSLSYRSCGFGQLSLTKSLDLHNYLLILHLVDKSCAQRVITQQHIKCSVTYQIVYIAMHSCVRQCQKWRCNYDQWI